MKKLSVFALLLSLGLFAVGCEPADDAVDTATTPDTTTDDTTTDEL